MAKNVVKITSSPESFRRLNLIVNIMYNVKCITKAGWVLVEARVTLVALTPPIVDVAGALTVNLAQVFDENENRSMD